MLVFEPCREKTSILHMPNKGADQLCSNCKADQCLCFRYIDSKIPLLSKSKNFQPLATLCACTAQFVSDLFGYHIVGFLITWLMCCCCDIYVNCFACLFELRFKVPVNNFEVMSGRSQSELPGFYLELWGTLPLGIEPRTS